MADRRLRHVEPHRRLARGPGRGILTIRDKQIDAKPVGPLLYPELMTIAVRKDSPKLRDAINGALDSLYKDGEYSSISKRWLGEDVL
ncbi:transporter substrate-binding domain-containing protein [Paraburkholderia sp. A3BS-1L]|uniref:transporter substrate-binding domain-containing protein n=1 Tax=Paraburkholderia sp. A3BS-1L TaxID=3028375 RepID=UPI003DA94B9B